MCKDRSKPMTPKYKSEVIDAMTEKQQQIIWSDYYLIKAEEDFDKIFNSIYTEHFVDILFPEHESMISMEYFKEQILNHTDESPPAKWVFDPSILREKFLLGFEQEDMAELEDLIDDMEDSKE